MLNSWIAGGNFGIVATGADEWVDVVLRNNTFSANGTAIYFRNGYDPRSTPGTAFTAVRSGGVEAQRHGCSTWWARYAA